MKEFLIEASKGIGFFVGVIILLIVFAFSSQYFCEVVCKKVENKINKEAMAVAAESSSLEGNELTIKATPKEFNDYLEKISDTINQIRISGHRLGGGSDKLEWDIVYN